MAEGPSGPSEREAQGLSGPSEREAQGLSGPSEREAQGPSGPSEWEAEGPVVHVVGLLGGRPVGAAAEEALRTAALVAGGHDQLAGVADLLAAGARTVVVGAGLGALDAVASSSGPACVLASGDPGMFGVLRPLTARIGSDRITVHPAPSSVALAFARLGLSWDRAVVRSCHRGGAARAAAEVAGAELAAVLCGPDAPPEAVGGALVALGAFHRTVAVATRLGEPSEQLHRCDGVVALAAGCFDPRSVVVLAHPAEAQLRPAGRPGGRPVEVFAHRASMITKPEVRSVVLGKLDVPASGVLWDVGAGSGSVAVEAALAAPGLRVIAVERNAGDAARVLANAATLGAVVEVVEGTAPEALADLPAPDRVFVGGGGLGVLGACRDALRPGGRLVATFAAVDRAAEAYRLLGSLVQVGVDRAEALPDGGVRLAADNPVFVAWGDRPEKPGVLPPGRVAVGIGCSSTATAEEITTAVSEALATAHAAADGRVPADAADGRVPADATAVAPPLPSAGLGGHGAHRMDPGFVMATIDHRRDHPAFAAASAGRPLVSFPAALLGLVEVPDPSEVVAAAVGTPSVAEAAALLAAGPGARLVVGKRRSATVTAAVAVGERHPGDTGRVQIVGLGPGHPRHRTPAAVSAVRGADAVIGYGPYVDAVAALLLPEQMVVRSAMGAEAERAGTALALARAGWRVAVVSSGDSGVFAMASLTLELAGEGRRRRPPVGPDDEVAVEVVPGLTAASAAAAAVGAPLAGPHAVLTLSDLLVPWATIEAQLRASASCGLALALYNPRSAGRPDHLARAVGVLLEVLDPGAPVAVVTAAGDAEEQIELTNLGDLDPTIAGMRSMVFVGTADTILTGGRMVTRRHHPRPDPAP